MRIGYDAKRLFSNLTGLGNYARNLVAHYHHYYPEDELALFTPRISDDPRINPFIQDHSLQIIRPKGFNPFWRSIDIAGDIRKNNIQIYHGLSHELPFGISKLDIGKIVTMHDVIFKYYPDDNTWIDRTMYDFKWKHACAVSDVIIAISEQTRADLIEHYHVAPEKIIVISQSADPVFSSHVTDDDVMEVKKLYHLPQTYFLYVGSVISRKNLLSIVQAIALMKKEDRAPLVIIGDGKAYKQKVIREAEKEQIGDLLIWMNKPLFHHFPAIYKSAMMMIYPSFHEGFGLPVIEAMHTGIPVITSNQSSLKEAGGDAAILIDPSRPAEIAAAMLKIAHDTSLKNELIARGKEHIKRFNPQALARELHAVYAAVS